MEYNRTKWKGVDCLTCWECIQQAHMYEKHMKKLKNKIKKGW